MEWFHFVSGIRVECTGLWNEFPGNNVLGGTASPAATTVDDCKLLCITGDTGCVGIDFDPGNKVSKCWLIFVMAARNPTARVTHYELVSKGCVEPTEASETIQPPEITQAPTPEGGKGTI